MLPAARIIGKPSAPVTAVVFTDFQCPFCKRFHAALAEAQARYPDAIATAVIHLPLAGHKNADPAARAAECAAAAGRFAQAVEILYEKQDSLGTLPWSAVAAQAGVHDTLDFTKCMSDSSAAHRVGIGSALAAARGFTSTPTVILNGWRYSVPPSDTELVRAIGDILAGRPPYKGFARVDLVSR
jgi:protein-disulfide isomerase